MSTKAGCHSKDYIEDKIDVHMEKKPGSWVKASKH